MLDALSQNVEEFFAKAVSAQPAAFACKAGCHKCCHADLTLFGIEAERLTAAFQELPARSRDAARRRAERDEHCAMLHPRTHRCIVYAARPLICRSFGLATLFEGEVSWCRLNFREAPPLPDCVLEIDRINQPLSLMEHLASKGASRRVSIAEIARTPAGEEISSRRRP